MDVLKIRRGVVKAKITRIDTFIQQATEDEDGDQFTIEDFSERLALLEAAYTDFNRIQEAILAIMNPAEQMQIEDYESNCVNIEDKYATLKASLKRCIASYTTEPNLDNSVGSSVTSNITAENMITRLIQQQTVMLDQLSASRANSDNQFSNIHLKPLKIPEFGGDYYCWNSFCDIFTNAVHSNRKLSNVQKLHYLKESLTGEAAQLIKHITITDANYDSAWELLTSRYDKKYHIVQALLKTFMEQPKSTQLTASSLRKVISTSNEIIHSLKALGPEYETRDCWLIYILLEKLDSDTKKFWSEKLVSMENPKFSDFISVIEKKCDALETCQLSDRKSIAHSSTNSRSSMHSIRTMQSSAGESKPCNYCSSVAHRLFQCKDFGEASVLSRRSFVQQKRLCYNCLSDAHPVTSCKGRFSCRICRKRHHTLLHQSTDSQSTTSSSKMEASTSSAMQQAVVKTPATHVSKQITTLTSNASHDFERDEYSVLPTLVIHTRDSKGTIQSLRALLDSGSNASLISEECVQRLGLERKNARVSVNAMSDVNIGIARGITEIEIFSRYKSTNSVKLKPYIMKKLASAIPSIEFDKSQWNTIHDLELADPDFNKVNKIDLIIGWGKFMSILREGEVLDSNGDILAKNTKFGYIVCGEFNKPQAINSFCSFSSPQSATESNNIDFSLEKFWLSEEIPQKKHFTAEEQFCEDHFKSTHSRNDEGRYVVRLPFKPDVTKNLGNSKFSAFSRLHAMERRYMVDSDYKNQYIDFMDNYEQMHHMKTIPKEEVTIENHQAYYLPHHAVFKDSSTTTKLRVVFDASNKTSTGVSLNDKLAVGPTIQDDIISIMLRFRSHAFVLKADIEKMYRQILVSSEDQNYQRILWRRDTSANFEHFKLQTVTYGTASAPFLATRAIKQLAHDNKQQYPETSLIIGRDFYVDDLMTGCDTEVEALKLQQELDKICLSAGFKLRKWASNSSFVLNNIPSSEREIEPFEINMDTSFIKTLGIFWSPFTDSFSFQVNLPPVTQLTKRSMLSDSSRLFDPFGWISPTIILVKILFQKLWLLDDKLGWDDQLPSEIAEEWLLLRTSLPTLMEIKLPRFIPNFQGEILLCGFCDASEKALSAVVYARGVVIQEITVNFVDAKTKVAPLKRISIPKSELNAAVLLTRLLVKISSSLTHLSVKSLAFTDSTIVLSWLSAPPHKWNTFVANRTSEILESHPSITWDHVSSKENPADCASRGISASDLVSHNLWWTGPAWLKNDQSTWTSKKKTVVDVQNAPEAKKSSLINLNVQAIDEDDCRFKQLIINKSNLSTILRITAFCLRFINNCLSVSQQASKSIGFLTTGELMLARNVFIKSSQRDVFSETIKCLNDNTPLKNHSHIRNLTPFIDRKGILRVGGRLEHSGLSYNTVHPIILPAESRFTQLLVETYHIKYLHAEVKLLTATLFQEYWIIGHRNLVRKIVHNCIVCFKQKAAISRQLMGNLPSQRITPNRVFSQVGCDFAGPFLVRRHKGRGGTVEKTYISLYICFATKAIHLELASDLSTDAFVATLKRFTSRRGVPEDIFCDNGTNFVGARRQLNEFQKLFRQQQQQEIIARFATSIGVNFHFNPPSAPHMGGLWEAGVKSVKAHLKRILTEARLTFEEFTTVLCQVEACVNSRPLCELSPDGLDVLTPSHFLIGQALTTLPEPNMAHIKTNRLNRWQHLNKLLNGFWAKWSQDYLITLQPRQKWTHPENNLVVNDLVLIHDKNMPPSQWARGRVIECHPGVDGLVRVVSLKTQHGFLKRPIHKLSILPKE